MLYKGKSKRPDSAKMIQADLLNMHELTAVAKRRFWLGGIDVLINNAWRFIRLWLLMAEQQWRN